MFLYVWAGEASHLASLLLQIIINSVLSSTKRNGDLHAYQVAKLDGSI
jgi:hypothetical protein